MTVKAVAQLRLRTEDPIPYIVSDTFGVEKGTLCTLIDPMTASGSSLLNCLPAGIAAREKIASSGITSIALFQRGFFDMQCSGAVTLGDPLVSAGDDFVKTWTPSTVSGSRVIGRAEETGSDGEAIIVNLNIGAFN